MVALHARRSAPAIEAYRAAFPGAPLAVVLTGTDLYRDLPDSPEVPRSLDAADRIVVLQEEAQRALAPKWRRKSQVIFQSARPLKPRAKPRARLACVVVGHLRDEKDPATLFAAMDRLPPDLPIRVRHIGAGLDPALEEAARARASREPRYRYSGALPHGATRAAIAAAHLLIHPSRMEGGANVIVEAITSGTAVIASRVPGNVGMLGRGYPGYFPVGDATALATCLVAAHEDSSYLRELKTHCRERKALFSPRTEAKAVCNLVSRLLARARR